MGKIGKKEVMIGLGLTALAYLGYVVYWNQEWSTSSGHWNWFPFGSNG